jgi:hypothetical protein
MIPVEPDPIEGEPIYALRALASRVEIGVHAGEIVGYWCALCQQSDETRREIIHEPACDLSGRHGRHVYGTELGPINPEHRGELEPEHGFAVLVWGVTDDTLGIHNGAVVAFRCDECAAVDEHLFEQVHDRSCSMAELPEYADA